MGTLAPNAYYQDPKSAFSNIKLSLYFTGLSICPFNPPEK